MIKKALKIKSCENNKFFQNTYRELIFGYFTSEINFLEDLSFKGNKYRNKTSDQVKKAENIKRIFDSSCYLIEHLLALANNMQYA